MRPRLTARRMVLATCLLLATAGLVAAGPTMAASAPVQKQGYITMTDGTKLAYAVELPSGSGRFPVAMAYAGYCEGSDPTCNDATNAAALVAAGYAVLGVNMRGTGCSTGTFDAFTAQEWRDGAAAVEWAARQPWSTGRVGMFGDSFPGITQLGVAGLRPPHLDAIAPFQVTTDLYRDVAYPGGIANTGFGAFWGGFDQPFASYSGAVERAVASKDTTCAGAQPADVAAEPTHNIALVGLQHPYDDSFWRAREPGANVDRIDVPVLGCLTWQDDEVSSRSLSYLDELDPARTWVVASNGYHGMCEVSAPRITKELVAFFDRFVRGDDNGFARTPHVQIWHDATTDAAGNDVPSRVTTFGSLASMKVHPLTLYFGPAGTLSLHPPKADQPPATYAYPGPALGTEDGIVFGQHNLLWKAEEPPGASLAFTTAPLTRATEFFGSGSADIWLSSTAPDTDLQITLTEVRPDGQETYVSRGWLRASHRAVDASRSTALAPYQTDQEADARPLVPGQPTYMRIQLWPFDYVFHKGASIRLWIDAPTGETGGWSFDFIKDPAVNSVYAGPHDPSALVLGQLTGNPAVVPLSTCDTVLSQPCRTNTVPVPAGTTTIPGGSSDSRARR
ncbi:MAG TPA: CocE/NonD family hydrolase [Actinomycetales bacterium]|nr:CocE/NonD family hydrolase [Actinomycetales bacterium]